MYQRVCALLALLVLLAGAVRASMTENHGLQILPATAKVAVDGQIADWDLSASVFACGDVENHRDKFAVWFSAMYDAENLYLLARWRDDTPLSNPGSTAGNFGWDGDCIQVRVVADYEKPTEQLNVYNCWYGADKRDVVERDAPGKTKNAPKGEDIKPLGAKQAFLVADDKRGYTQEIAIPWAHITKDGQPRQAGDALVLTIEPNFTAGPTNGRMSIKDIFRAGVAIDRVFTFQNKRIWGIAKLEAAGKVTPRALRLADGREFAVQLQNGLPVVDWTGIDGNTARPGFKPLRFEMPEDGYVSLQVLNANGEVVRNVLTGEFFAKGAHEVKWDGMTAGFFRNPGQPVPAGTYSWRAIWHKGIGIRLRGWACNSGQSPWDGPNAGDNWGGDMGAPAAVATDGTKMFLGWAGSEAGKALVVTDLNATVLWRHKRGGFGGAQYVAIDAGTAYVFDTQDNSLFCLSSETGMYVPWAGGQSSTVPVDALWPAGVKDAPKVPGGLDARNGRLYLSANLPTDGFVAILNTKDGKVLKSIPVPAPTTIKVANDGLFYVVSAGSRVLAVDVATGNTRTVIDGLSQATGLTLDAAGNFYVGTREPDHQVKVYSPQGKLLRAIGKKGGRQVVGVWQAEGMREIAGIGLDPQGQLWVTESTLYPRRISVWNAKTGTLVRELFGPTHYGASGGAIHPKDPNVMVGEGCEWRLDPQTGQASCAGVFDAAGQSFLGGNGFARFCTGANGRDYLAVTNSPNITIYERLAPGKYAVRAMLMVDLKANKTTFWADENDDRQLQEGETAVLAKGLMLGGYYYWSMFINTDMTIYGGGSALPVAGFTACGAPKYDLTAFSAESKLLPGVPSLDNKLVLVGSNMQEPFYRCYDVATGKLRWQYPNEFAGVHGSHAAPPAEPGLLRGVFGPVGSAKVPTAGDIWALNTNVGEWHLLTQDGYYLSRLFEPDALKCEFPKAAPGAVIDRVPSGLGGEDFGGSLVQAPDGTVYLQAGKTGLWNCQLTGLDTIKPLGNGPLAFTTEDVQSASQIRETMLQQYAGIQRMTAAQATSTFTGNLNADFNGTQIIAYRKQADAAVRTAMAWDATRLYVAWEVTDKTPWVNGATDPAMLYLSGDTVDLQLGTNPNAPKDRGEAVAGDLRLSIGNFQGTPTAVLFRKVVAEGGVKQPKSFSSGVVKDYRMEYVAVLADANVQVRVNAGNSYLVEASIPLAALGLAPQDALTLRGDFGVTHGDPAGQRTRLRTYWSNQKTGIVDDAVYELMMEPRNWGELIFKR